MEEENLRLLRKLNKILHPTVKLRIAYNSFKSSAFFSNKDKIPDCLKSQLVYQYVCDQCPDAIYTGETVRHFATRSKEHLTGRPKPTEVSLHKHEVKKSNFKIVVTSKRSLITEALVYNTVNPKKRLNEYRPPFDLKLFNFQSYLSE